MLRITKIRAFTIVELAVTMVISSIVVAAAIYVFFTFNNMLFNTNKNNLNDLEIIQLQQVLKKDFTEANEIYFQYESVIIKYYSGDKIYYEIEESRIIRDAINGIDTFNIEVYDIFINYTEENPKLVNEMILEIEIENLDFPIHVVKKYPAYKLIKQ